MRVFGRRFVGLVICSASCLLAGACGETPDEVVPPPAVAEAPSYPMRVPEGWVRQRLPGMADDMLMGPRGEGFTPNVNFVQEPFAGTLEEYVSANLQVLPTVVERFTLLSRSDAVTEEGVPMVRIVASSFTSMRELRQVAYFLKSGDRCFVITCSALLSDGSAFDDAFDEAATSFRIPG